MACPRIEPGQAQRQPAVVRFLRVFCAFFAGPCRSTIGMQIPGVSHDLASSTLMAATGQGSAVRTGVTPMLEYYVIACRRRSDRGLVPACGTSRHAGLRTPRMALSVAVVRCISRSSNRTHD
jgi:hypothetical protein